MGITGPSRNLHSLILEQSFSLTEKVLRGLLYFFACLNVFHIIIAGKYANNILSGTGIVILFIIAVARVSPKLSMLKTVFAILLPLLALIFLYSINPIKTFVAQHINEIGLLSLFYAVMFSIIGDRISAKERMDV